MKSNLKAPQRRQLIGLRAFFWKHTGSAANAKSYVMLLPLAMLFLMICLSVYLGIHAASNSMEIELDTNGVALPPIDQLIRLEDVDLDGQFYYRLPLFFRMKNERHWWATHKELSEVLSTKSDLRATYRTADGGVSEHLVTASSKDMRPVLKSMSSTYFIVLIFLCAAAFTVIPRRNSQGLVLAGFLLSCALYLSSAVPLVTRQLTLPFDQLRQLVVLHYIACAGFITIVHYALIFPRPKAFLAGLPLPLASSLYIYMTCVIVLYASGLIPFGATDPLMFFWIAVTIGSFVHSIVTEREPFLRNQIVLTLSAPILAASTYAVFSVSPQSLGTSAERFLQFGIFTSVMAFALPAAMDNVRLYKERVAVARESNEARERLGEELHDKMLRELSSILALAQAVSALLPEKSSARSKVDRIKSSAVGYSRYVRKVMQIAERVDMSWSEFASQLREVGYEAVEPHDIHFSLTMEAERGLLPPTISTRVAMYKVFSESLANTLVHAKASRLDVTLSTSNSAATLVLRDNGIGFATDADVDGHYGMARIQAAVEEVGGVFDVTSQPSDGTTISAVFPVESG